MRKWVESSAAERNIAGKIVPLLQSANLSETDICEFLETLPFGAKSKSDADTHVSRLVSNVFNEVPELRDVDFASVFPISDTDLTANVLGRIAQDASVQFHDPTLYGVVATPHVLAQDMVNISAAALASERLKIELKAAIQYINTPEECPTDLTNKFREILSTATWWDPCVGAGVFPLCILRLAQRWKLNVLSVAGNVSGTDLNPLSVAATRIRMALALCSWGVKVNANAPELEGIEVADSLKVASEQPTMYGARLTSFDVVIGNPPYVRADRLSTTLKTFLRDSFPSIATGTVDLYNYFIALGLSALRESGILCFISPANFQKSRYGRTTRHYISKAGAVRALFDFDELPVFEGAGVHPSVYVVAKARTQGDFIGVAFKELPESTPLTGGILKASWMPSASVSAEGWRLVTASEQNILELLRKDSMPLNKYAGAILSGIKTGKKDVFLLPKSEADSFLQDEHSRRFLKPLLRPVDVRRWYVDWDGTQLLRIRMGETVPETSLLLAYLRAHELELRGRQDVQGHPTWYGLRACSYYEAFDKPKILFPDIAYGCRFVMDTEGFYVPDGAFLIPSEDYFLLGVLNSCIADFFFRASCTSIGNAQHDGRIRFKKTYVEHFPIPTVSAKNRHLAEHIETIARQMSGSCSQNDEERAIDELVLQLYNVPEHLWPNLLRTEPANVQ
jgi:hypothetical protein